MHKLFQQLTICWEMPDPPVAPKEWVELTPQPTSAEAEQLGISLGLGAQTIGYLDAAFAHNLNRFYGWQAADEAQGAARVFKRGVYRRSRSNNTVCTVKRRLSGSYAIDFMADIEATQQTLSSYRGWLFVIDQRVADAWPWTKTLQHKLITATSEMNKSLQTVSQLVKAAAGYKGIVSIGGGILGDLTGFAAYLTSLPVVFVPTTLLAMADACVGGKTGVNYHPHGKNQVGAFYFPERVVVCHDWLTTLDHRDLLGGTAECLKHMFLMGDLNRATEIAQGKLADNLLNIIQVKADVVAKDPAETGQRATLNLGHTLAHALEAYSHLHCPKDHIFHGEAVGIGLRFALHLSENLGILAAKDANTMRQILSDADVVLSAKQLAHHLAADLRDPELWQHLKALIRKDKKATATDDTTNWIVMAEPGKAARGPAGNYLVAVQMQVLDTTWQTFLDSLV